MPGESPLTMMRAPKQHLRRPAAGRRRRRWPVLVPIAAMIVLAAAWSGLWYYAASVASRTLAGWVEREAAAGRIYSCGVQSIDGFPFAISARCADAAVQITSAKAPYNVEAKAVTFAADLWHPTKLIGDVAAPLKAGESDRAAGWIADWRRARVEINGRPPDPEAILVLLEQPRLDRGGDETRKGAPSFKADRLALQGRIVGGAPNNHPLIELTLRLAGASAPFAHPLLAESLDAQFDGVVRGLKDLSPKPWRERVGEMQAAGGGIEVKSLRLSLSKIIVVGAGTITLNGGGKLDGLLRVAIVGLDRLVPLLGGDRLLARGIDALAGSAGAAAQGAAALDRLIPGLGAAVRDSANHSLIENLKKMGEAARLENQPAIVLPLRFSDGAVYLGMLRLGDVPPLI